MPGMNSTTENPSSFYKCLEESVTRILRRVPWPSWIPGPDLVEWVNREQGSGGRGVGWLRLTFRGRIGTLSLSEFIPGMMTVIRRGPRKPKTLVS